MAKTKKNFFVLIAFERVYPSRPQRSKKCFFKIKVFLITHTKLAKICLNHWSVMVKQQPKVRLQLPKLFN